MRTAVALALVVSLAAGAASAQQTERLRGTIEAVAGQVLTVKAADGKTASVTLADDATVFAQFKATLDDIKVGDFVGVGAMPQPDGSQRAIQVAIFPEALRGIGEGHRPWSRGPNSTMTNATVETAVAGVDGRVLLVKYKDGEKKIVVPPEASLVGYAVGEKGELKPGAMISIAAATKQADGSYRTARISVGRGGYAPQ